MKHMRGYWAAAEAAIGLGTFGWAYFLFVDQHELFWPASTIVAGIFFLVAAWLFAANHPDGRVVGLFGLMFFAIANIIMPFADPQVRGPQLVAVLGAVAALGAAEGLVLYGVGRKPRTDDEPGLPM